MNFFECLHKPIVLQPKERSWRVKKKLIRRRDKKSRSGGFLVAARRGPWLKHSVLCRSGTAIICQSNQAWYYFFILHFDTKFVRLHLNFEINVWISIYIYIKNVSLGLFYGIYVYIYIYIFFLQTQWVIILLI